MPKDTYSPSTSRKTYKSGSGSNSVSDSRLKPHNFKRTWADSFVDPIDGGVSLGGPAGFLPTTKSERFQNIPDLCKTHGDTEFHITELLDGISVMFYDVFECHRPEDGVDLHSALPGVILLSVCNEWNELGNGVRCREFFGISSGDHDYEETEASISWKALKDQGIVKYFADKNRWYGTGWSALR